MKKLLLVFVACVFYSLPIDCADVNEKTQQDFNSIELCVSFEYPSDFVGPVDNFYIYDRGCWVCYAGYAACLALPGSDGGTCKVALDACLLICGDDSPIE